MLEIRNILEIAVISSVLLFIFFNKMSLVQAYAFLIPFYGIDYDIGIRITISQIVLLILNIKFFIQFASNPKIESFAGLRKSVVLFLFYAFTSAFLMSNFVIDFIQTSNPGFLRNEGRYLSQIINISLWFSIFYIIYKYTYTINDLLKILRFFLIGIIIVSSIGFIQEVVYVLTGIDITPLPGGYEYIRKAAEFNYFGIPLIRINSLAGEPKSLGMYAAIGIIMLKVLNNLNLQIIKYQQKWNILFWIVLVLTLSSSGFIMVFILWIISELMLRYINLLPKFTIKKVFSWIFIGIIIILFSNPLEGIIKDRVTEREKIEDWDAVVLEGLKENPQYLIFGSGLGNIHNIAAPYIDRFENLGFMEENIFVAKSGYLRIFSETGIVGFILFIIFNLQIIFHGFINYKRQRKEIFALFMLLSTIAFVAYMSRTYVGEYYLLMMALANLVNKQFV